MILKNLSSPARAVATSPTFLLGHYLANYAREVYQTEARIMREISTAEIGCLEEFNINAWPSSIAVESEFSKTKKLIAPDRCSMLPARANDYLTGSSGLTLLRRIRDLRKRRRDEKSERSVKKVKREKPRLT